MKVHTILADDKLFDQNRFQQLRHLRVSRLFAIGNTYLLATKKLGLLCSSKCPGKLILQTHDVITSFHGKEVSVVSGFHSPIEKECLNILLRADIPVIVCPARSLDEMRIAPPWESAVKHGDMLLLSAFAANNRRSTKQMAIRRNNIVAVLADKVFMPYAAEGSRSLELAEKMAQWGKPILTLGAPENSPLFELGARPFKGVEDFV